MLMKKTHMPYAGHVRILDISLTLPQKCLWTSIQTLKSQKQKGENQKRSAGTDFMSTGTGNGKIILFGEHFVVYGCPAIALGISNKAIVEITKAEELKYTSDTKGTIPELTTGAIKNVLKAMDIKDNFHVHLGGDLETTGGLGSSAAFCVALVDRKSTRLNS